MIKIGDYNSLVIRRMSPVGLYLEDKDNPGTEVLLPNRYVTDEMEVGEDLEVFVYTDSEDRPVATTERPYVRVGEFAFLQTVQVNRVGAFLDWGLTKNLLVPFKEQKIKMFPGGLYLVYVYLDQTTKRVVASAKIEKFLDNVLPDYSPGDEVKALVIGRHELGYTSIVDNLHRGMIYNNEITKVPQIGETVRAYVKNVREVDSRIDLTLRTPKPTLERIDIIADRIVTLLKSGNFNLSDKSKPEEIQAVLECSKKDFKKAVGLLYKKHRIVIDEGSNLHLPLTK